MPQSRLLARSSDGAGSRSSFALSRVLLAPVRGVAMGHLVGKDLYRQLGTKVDGLPARAPWNEALYAILKELYSEEEARFVVRMPFGLAPLHRIAKVTATPAAEAQQLLEAMCRRGLV